MIKKGLWVLLIVSVLAGRIFAILDEDHDDKIVIAGSFQEDCAARCFQNRSDNVSHENICQVHPGVACKFNKCTKRCAAWEQALETDCPSVCNGTQKIPTGEEINCVMYCNEELDNYFEKLKAEIGVLPAPALVADSLTATSLRLEWKGIDIKRRPVGVQYLVQWQYEEHADDWQYCRNQSWNENDQMIFVENLQPYKKYRFRVALLLKSSQHNPKPIVSDPSVVIQTLAAGRPTSAPVIVRAVAVDSYRVSVSWEPGPFPNGPLLSYVLQLQGTDDSLLNKDIPAAENIHHYLYQNLKPNQTYSGSVRERNAVGDGPPACFSVTTPPSPAVTDTQQPVLIVGGEYVVRKQGDMLDKSSIIYRASSKILGVAVHIASGQLFISDVMGYIYKTSINDETSEPIVVLRPNQINFKPLSLSVDWLNSHLYILGEVNHTKTMWQIVRCNLDGKGLTVAMALFTTRPSHIEVDPFNGYLFWITKIGLYRLDLADISNGIKHETQPYLILEDSNLGAFTVDHRNFRLLVSHQTQNTVVSVSLDGRECLDIRNNTQQSQFQNVVSIATANGLFYWTNGFGVLSEDYFPEENKYFHTAFSGHYDSLLVSVHVLMNTSQPVPVPVNPPTAVQAVLGSERAKVSWQVPHLLGGQGKGAWQNWTYELEVKDEINGDILHQRNIAGSSYSVLNLREKTDYTIKVAAYTGAGQGPWSSEFHGKTLGDNSRASILWSANEGLLKSDVTGENVSTLIVYKEGLKNMEKENYIVDVSWYKDTLYFVGDNNYLYSYNITSNEKKNLSINSVGSVAVDWIAKKLYWASPKQHIITRSNLDGSQHELVSVLAIVKELIVDSREAYLYWSTSHTVEVARLNGLDPRSYYSENVFNGIQVMGLTLDTENHFVYWIVRSYESGSIVYRAPTSENIPITQKIIPEKVSSLQHPNMQGPLCYFSEHLLWLQDDRNAVIGDLTGQNTAVINGISLIGLHMVAIMDPALHQYPKYLSSTNISVIPDAVELNSIRVSGSWKNFNITWTPVNNINYGTVFYEVKFTDYINTNSNPEITTKTTMPYNNSGKILPYSLLEISVKAFTYWGTAMVSKQTLRSPQSVPSQPTNVRAFVEYKKSPINQDIDIIMTVRWNLPEYSNGVIKDYGIKCWWTQNEIDIQIFDTTQRTVNKQYEIPNLMPSTTYYFQVQAFTEIGPGNFSDVIEISTERENPVPQIIASTSDSIKLIDLDLQSNSTITKHTAIEIGTINAENKIYWINEMQEILTADLKGNNVTKILSLNGTVTSLCIDWVSRYLYWSETIKKSSSNTLWKLDIGAWEAGNLIYTNLTTRNSKIKNIQVSPLTDDLFWIELKDNDDDTNNNNNNNNNGIIMRSNLNGDNVKTFLNHDNGCSCPDSPLIKPVMTIDTTDLQNPDMYWISLEGNLNIAAIDDCACNSVITVDFNRVLPLFSLTVDKANIYWLNTAKNETYYINKIYPNDLAIIRNISTPSVRDIKAIGRSLQPYPNPDCLIPEQISYNVEQLSNKSNSITVKLPDAKIHLGCEKYNLPGTSYTIYVSQCNQINCNVDKKIIKTYNKEIEIKNLKPFTIYEFKLALSNYYTELKGLPLNTGDSVMLQTANGAPSAPENVTIKALNPVLAAVYWSPPKVLNAAAVRYEIHWRSLELVNGVRQTGEQLVKNMEIFKDGRYMAMLQPLLPGQDYTVYVRAFPSNSSDVSSESEGKIVSMYPEPNNLTLENVTINSMLISWLPTENIKIQHTLQFTMAALEKWQTVEEKKTSENRIEYQINGLLSKSLYKFRLILRYPTFNQDFIWPNDARFTYQTLGDVPSVPGIPTVTKLRNSVYQLNWSPAQAHGSQVTMYVLEGKIIKDPLDNNNNSNNNNDDDKLQEWNIYYNGTDNYWIIVGEMNYKYKFRVKARNAYGFGDWSLTSTTIDLTDTFSTTIAGQQHLGLILGLSVPIVTIVLLCFSYFLCLYNRQRKDVKKAILPPIVSDVELATLREIPRGNFIQSNALYATSMQAEHDDLLLPKIRKDQIVRIKFLGSGAFGEVYQGTAKGIEGTEMTKIAIKTLRKGASAQEKTEFLQEAQLMSHFKHKHVLRLLGVCIDPDGPQLVLELMEAGDLLTYLRTSRFYSPTDHLALRLRDLLSMCEDVARGCRYLEELHFVHRDLACRNCLVSAKDRENRVVKIGDFGLARDIYKNDYYRKEGEGLLPVRWMSPESLLDGVFTTQSDVWAFGVLMWEITSLGQQPYPARSNGEVLVYVRNGGRLNQPDNCPETLYDLMQRCWSQADSRPSFKNCLERIIVLKKSTADAMLTPIQAGHYATRRGNSWKSSSSEGSRDMKPFLQNSAQPPSESETPKYLELIPDSSETKENHQTDEYEIPRSIPISNKIFADDRKHLDEILSQIGTLNLLTEKSQTLDHSRKFMNDLRATFAERSILRMKHSQEGSNISLNDQNCNSLSSSIGSLRLTVPPTRPSSSVLECQQQNLQTKNNDSMNNIKENNNNNNNNTNNLNEPNLSSSNSTLRLNKNHIIGKANIPLVINSPLLNLLRQTPGIEDSLNIVTYTNVNTDTTRVK